MRWGGLAWPKKGCGSRATAPAGSKVLRYNLDDFVGPKALDAIEQLTVGVLVAMRRQSRPAP